MSADRGAQLDFTGVSKRHSGPEPLRIAAFQAGPADRVVLHGFSVADAEMFIHLATGASLADEGDVRVGGRNTRDIATDTEWLASLDRFGIVTDRAVLIEKIATGANLALPLTLAIDPMSAETRVKVEALAAEVGLALPRLDDPASALGPAERVRLHLARAIAPDPAILLLEHPTATIADPYASASFGAALKAVAARRGIGFVAISDDDGFAKASGGMRLRLDAASGRLDRLGFWRSIW